MRTLCTLTSIALALSALSFFLAGLEAPQERLAVLRPLIPEVNFFDVLVEDFWVYANYFFAALAHGLLAIVVATAPGRHTGDRFPSERRDAQS